MGMDTAGLRDLLIETAESLSGAERAASWPTLSTSSNSGNAKPHVCLAGAGTHFARPATRSARALPAVYYPPYHSEYNPIERCWGMREVYWNGELLDSEEAVLGFAANMTYAGRHPHVDRSERSDLAAACDGGREKKSCWKGDCMPASRVCPSGR